jgi:hydrogenase maturation protein HypF
MCRISRKNPMARNRMSAKSSFSVDVVATKLKPAWDILALGTDAQLRLAWSQNRRIFTLSPKKQPAGPDLFYQEACFYLARRKRLTPRFIAFDPHPYFECCRQAAALQRTFFPSAQLKPVFHHVAHAALAAHQKGLLKNFIALTWDGTGFGADGKVWGGEFFVYRNRCFRRAAHFSYQYLPGNESAILEPWRVAFAALHRIYGKKIFSLDLRFLKGRSRESLGILIEMMKKGFSSPLTSSVGRLFDAGAAILMLPSPGALEACAAEGRTRETYPFEIVETKEREVINPDLMFERLVDDFRMGVCRNDIALKFHRALAECACVIAIMLRKKFGISKIYCSGGVFMNDVLRREMARIFASESFEVIFAPKALTTDAGIALGQIAACVMGETCV